MYDTRETCDAYWGTLGMSMLSGSSVMSHRYGACDSLHPVRMDILVASLNNKESLLKVTVQSELQMGPTHSRVWLKPGII